MVKQIKQTLMAMALSLLAMLSLMTILAGTLLWAAEEGRGKQMPSFFL